jgi:hypothetical protein
VYSKKGISKFCQRSKISQNKIYCGATLSNNCPIFERLEKIIKKLNEEN